MAESTVTIPIGKCRCPGKPHADGDTVSIDHDLGAAAGIAAAAVLAAEEGLSYAQRVGLMLEHVMPLSIREWTLEQANGDGKNHRIQVTADTVRQQLTWERGGAEVAMAAFKQYGAALGIPFAPRTPPTPPDSGSTPTGLTEKPSTSPRSAGRRKRPTRSE